MFLARIKAYNSRAAADVKDFHILRPIPQTQIDRTEGGSDGIPAEPGVLVPDCLKSIAKRRESMTLPPAALAWLEVSPLGPS